MTRIYQLFRLWRSQGTDRWLSARLAWLGARPIQGGVDTEFATGAAETVQRWATEVWREAPAEMQFGKFMARELNAVIQEKTDLEGKPGDRITFTLSRKPTGAGVLDDADLEGQEEQLVYYSDTATLAQRRNAVRLRGRMSERRTAFNQRQDATDHLRTWLAETVDDNIYDGFANNPAASRIQFGGTATSVATLTSTMVITPALIDRIKARSLKADPKIWPVRIAGRDWYVLLLHTDSAYDLQQDATWHAAQRDANIRGDENPIFTGRMGTWRGVVVHEHEKVPVATDGGAAGTVAWASNMFLGRQAGLIAWGMRPQGWEKEFEYGARTGFAIGAIWGFKKAVFNALDHAYFELRVARTNT